MIIGSAVHLGLSRLLKGEDPGNFFEESLLDNGEPIEVIWKDKPEAAKTWATKMLYQYYESVGKHLDVISTEQELLIEIPGVDIPLLGYVDIETTRGIIDVKTTGYFSRKPELNPEWKLQMNIYQLRYPNDGEFHILTRSKTAPIVVPSSTSDPLFVGVPRSGLTDYLRKIYSVMGFYYETFGEEIAWPGNLTHPWAAKYCPLGNLCCQKL